MQKERTVMHLLLKNAVLVFVVAAIVAPLAGAGTGAGTLVRSGTFYDGYKSSYPQLHATLSGSATPVTGSGTFYDGYKSSYPQLHATLSAHVTPVPGRGFAWRDASVGAGTASGVIFLLAGSALLFLRRRTRLAV
jgi:hypothetical protein